MRIKDQDGESVFDFYADTEAALLTQAERDLAEARELAPPPAKFTKGRWALCMNGKKGLVTGQTYAIREVMHLVGTERKLLMLDGVPGCVDAVNFTPADTPF